jgi:signal peptidase II
MNAPVPAEGAPATAGHPWYASPFFLGGVGAGVVLLDQIAKILILRSMVIGQTVPVLGPVMSLTLHHNRGAAMGLIPLTGRPLAVVAAVFALAVLVWGRLYARHSAWIAWGLALLLGGAVGNLIDRLYRGFVVDFLDFHFWPVFNVADCAVVIGAALIVVDAFRRTARPELVIPKESD